MQKTKKEALINAAHWLNRIKGGYTHGIDSMEKWVRESLLEAGATLEDIASSEEDFMTAIRNCYELKAKYTAKYFLNLIKEGTSSSGVGVDILEKRIHEYLLAAGATLRDIGSSEEELAELVRNFSQD